MGIVDFYLLLEGIKHRLEQRNEAAKQGIALGI